MARKSRAPAKVQKAIRTLSYQVPAGVSYIDIMKDLSAMNRKLFRQGMAVGIESVEYFFTPNGTVDIQRLQAYTAGDSWSVHNAHVKGHALWNQMNQLVLEDNPSVQGKWADFKVTLESDMNATNILSPFVDGTPLLMGEWNYSDYVMPQHDVDPVTGLPLPAEETKAHLLGDDLVVGTDLQSVGLVNAYQESRATVFEDAPNVPAAFDQAFFNLLTDSGSQEPELANVIRGENEDPLYDLDNYPGGAGNAVRPIETDFAVTTIGSPVGIMQPFIAQCGLIKLRNLAFNLAGESVTAPTIFLRINVMPGKYKGIAAVPMGQ